MFVAARAAPYEKGTETTLIVGPTGAGKSPRARPPMRRGLKPPSDSWITRTLPFAARAAPYEKGTETWCSRCLRNCRGIAARAAPYEKGTETIYRKALDGHHAARRARGPL